QRRAAVRRLWRGPCLPAARACPLLAAHPPPAITAAWLLQPSLLSTNAWRLLLRRWSDQRVGAPRRLPLARVARAVGREPRARPAPRKAPRKSAWMRARISSDRALSSTARARMTAPTSRTHMRRASARASSLRAPADASFSVSADTRSLAYWVKAARAPG